MSEGEAALYEGPFRWVQERVYPMRQRNPREARRKYWYRHFEPPQRMWQALNGLSRYIATAVVAKHRLFGWCDARICPDKRLIVIAPLPTTQPSASCTADFMKYGRCDSARGTARATTLSTPRPPPSRRSVPKRIGAQCARYRLRRRLARRRHRGRSQAAGRVARPVAQPARMCRVAERAGSRAIQPARCLATRPPQPRSRSAR